ncbi:segregation and condensation protein B [Clostridium sp. CAG:921]|nr:segregation and condensation protein B [Clostridium sp. CAG:921]
MDKILENDFEDDLTNVVESIMFALGREISAKEIASTLHVEQKQIENSLEVLMEKYNITSGVVLIKVKDSYQLVTNNKNYKYVAKFVENTKKQSLSTAALETLSIIAYNPKITKSEIETIRGVNSDFAVNRLLECGLVEEVARLNLPGRPAAYSVTNEFLKSCNIEDVSCLPKFDEIRIKDEQMLISDFEKDDQTKA